MTTNKTTFYEEVSLLDLVEIEKFDYKCSKDEDPNLINQFERNRKRKHQAEVVDNMFTSVKRRFDRLIIRANNFFHNGYKTLTNFDKNKAIRRIDLRFSKILERKGLYGPRAQELINDYRQKLIDLEAKATGRAYLFR